MEKFQVDRSQLKSLLSGLSPEEKLELAVKYPDDDIGIKILEYYAMASIAKNHQSDIKTYNYLRRICVQEYQKINYESSKETILKYVDKKFLKVK